MTGRGVLPRGLRKGELASFTVRPNRTFCAKHELDVLGEFAFAVDVAYENAEAASERPALSDAFLAPAADTRSALLTLVKALYS